ncbi:DUF6455 family protein [Halomonas korlensis]|uniref:DUF6455 domain-containing protein n=1 Tax=Halomonas korlensis TaxID=463301 RepID=A0A1I7I469_9GAMM|nr:DUF6455 family protein [Halomonas korlensis]SFU67694.1 hypothetical protein SAMN04487955_10611 [Halomonas korlensis]
MTTLRDGINATAERLAHTMAGAWRRGRQHREWLGLDEAGRESRLRDLGLARIDVPLFWSEGSSASDLLPRMMAVYGVDEMTPLVVGNGVKRDLERVCTLCPQKARCARVLDDAPEPETCGFCPNASTLEALGSH